MSDRPMTVEDVLDPAPGEKEPGYDEWLRERVRRSIARDEANPHERRTGAEVRARMAERIKKHL